MPFVRDGDLRIRYEVHGEGPPLVLLHGFSAGIAALEAGGVLALFASAFRVLAIDLRGHGESSRPTDPEAYAIDARARDVLRAMDAAGFERAHVVGYSMGGFVGFGIARLAPERIRTLTLGGTHPYPMTLAPLRMALEGGIGAWMGALEASVGPLPPDIAACVRGNDVAALRAMVARDREDESDVIAKLTMPCLFYVGERDPLRAGVERCARAVTGSTLVVIPDLDHFQGAFRFDAIFPRIVDLAVGDIVAA